VQTARLGRTNLEVSRICLGGMSLGSEREWMARGDAATRIVRKAIDLGINYFDTADVYSDGGSEEILGQALAGYDHVVVASKVGLQFGADSTNAGLAPKRIRRQLEGTLARLRRRRVELYQIHRWDYGTPIADSLRALDEEVRAGRIEHLGASSMFAWQFLYALQAAEREGWEPFRTMQDRYSLVYREEEREMHPLCRQFGISVVPYSPLAAGFLSGKYHRGKAPDSVRYRSSPNLRTSYFFDNDFDVLDATREVAQRHGVEVPIVALAWLLSKPVVASVIVGATKPEHLDDAARAVELRLTPEDIAQLEERYQPHRLIGPIPLPDA
jgi:1-deoxyxylulose-5-phosphate synthase